MKFIINAQKIIHETLDGEPVIINLDNGNYYSIDKSGRDIWEFIERGYSVDMMVSEFTCRYGKTPEAMEVAVLAFLSVLQKEDLVLAVDALQVNDMEVASGSTSSPICEAAIAVFEPPVLHKYTDMQGLLMLDPIHEVDDIGWPHVNSDRK